MQHPIHGGTATVTTTTTTSASSPHRILSIQRLAHFFPFFCSTLLWLQAIVCYWCKRLHRIVFNLRIAHVDRSIQIEYGGIYEYMCLMCVVHTCLPSPEIIIWLKFGFHLIFQFIQHQLHRTQIPVSFQFHFMIIIASTHRYGYDRMTDVCLSSTHKELSCSCRRNAHFNELKIKNAKQSANVIHHPQTRHCFIQFLILPSSVESTFRANNILIRTESFLLSKPFKWFDYQKL